MGRPQDLNLHVHELLSGNKPWTIMIYPYNKPELWRKSSIQTLELHSNVSAHDRMFEHLALL